MKVLIDIPRRMLRQPGKFRNYEICEIIRNAKPTFQAHEREIGRYAFSGEPCLIRDGKVTAIELYLVKK